MRKAVIENPVIHPAFLERGGRFKVTGAGNVFMVFGEPDVELHTLPVGKLQVELRGLDVYDPTTGEIRSSSTDDIACWFIDSDYNEESFFDEPAGPSLYGVVSRPLDAPSTGKLAVRVISHHWDEVLWVKHRTGIAVSRVRVGC